MHYHHLHPFNQFPYTVGVCTVVVGVLFCVCWYVSPFSTLSSWPRHFWTRASGLDSRLDCGLDSGLDSGLNYGPDYELIFGLSFRLHMEPDVLFNVFVLAGSRSDPLADPIHLDRYKPRSDFLWHLYLPVTWLLSFQIVKSSHLHPFLQ